MKRKSPKAKRAYKVGQKVLVAYNVEPSEKWVEGVIKSTDIEDPSTPYLVFIPSKKMYDKDTSQLFVRAENEIVPLQGTKSQIEALKKILNG